MAIKYQIHPGLTVKGHCKMFYPISILSLVLLALIHLSNGLEQKHFYPNVSSTDKIPFATRAYWMRKAVSALSELDSPCPFGAFGTVIVNHTDTSTDARGKLVCIGINHSKQTGNPTLHGEKPFTVLLRRTDTEQGRYKQSPIAPKYSLIRRESISSRHLKLWMRTHP
jgi:hypothetical protein